MPGIHSLGLEFKQLVIFGSVKELLPIQKTLSPDLIQIQVKTL